MSTCAKCGNHVFQIQESEPSGSNVKWFFVQCMKCGAPVGVVDFYPNSTVLKHVKELEKGMKQLQSDMANVDHMLRQIASRP